MSRELDKRVWAAFFSHDYDWAEDENGECEMHIHGRCHGDVPCYSTSIADAFLVVEKMWEDGWKFGISSTWQSTSNPKWEAWFMTTRKNSFYQIFDDSAPLAICRAALAAKEEENAS